MKGRHFLR